MSAAMKEISSELDDCVCRINFIAETVNSNADLDSMCTARHGMTLVLKDIEAKLAEIRGRLTVRKEEN